MRSRPLALLSSVLLLALVGCSTPTVIPPAAPASEGQPLFATDEEALAAATEAYEEFLAVSSQILQDGGAEPERLRPLVSDDVYETELEGFDEFSNNGWRATGQSDLLRSELQQHVSGDEATVEVVIYVCVDLSGTDVISAETGESVVSADRPSVLGFEVVLNSSSQAELIIDDERVWIESSVCVE